MAEFASSMGRKLRLAVMKDAQIEQEGKVEFVLSTVLNPKRNGRERIQDRVSKKDGLGLLCLCLN